MDTQMRCARRLQTIDGSLTAVLADRGPAAGSLGEPVSRIASLPLLTPPDGAGIGIWESTPGRWPRAIASAEFCLIIAGRGSFEQDGAEPVLLEPGAVIFFPADTKGLWVVEETVRKLYVLL